jgi:RHS repeat-associated protein
MINVMATPHPASHIAKINYEVSKVSGNSMLLNPGHFLYDGEIDSAWQADCTAGEAWVEIKLGNVNYINGIRVYKIDKAAIEVIYADGSQWLPIPHEPLAGLTGWQTLDLSPLDLQTDSLRVILKASGETGLGELEVYGGPVLNIPVRLNPVVVSHSSNTKTTFDGSNLFDGNTYTPWDAEIAGADRAWASAEFGQPVSIEAIKLYSTGPTSDQYNIELRESGTWFTEPELTNILGSGFSSGWCVFPLSRTHQVEAIRLEAVRTTSHNGNRLTELEFWGTGANPVRPETWVAFENADTNGYPALQNCDTIPHSGMEVYAALSDQALMLLNSKGNGTDFAGDKIEKAILSASQLIIGANELRWKAMPGGTLSAHGILVRSVYHNGQIAATAPENCALIDGSTIAASVVGGASGYVEITLPSLHLLDHMQLYLPEPGQVSCNIEIFDGTSWLIPQEGSQQQISVAAAGWYAIDLTGLASKIRINSPYSFMLSEFKVFGSPLTDRMPIITSLSSEETGSPYLVKVLGTVDNPSADVTVDGQVTDRNGLAFSKIVDLSPFINSNGKVVNVVATDESGRECRKNITIYTLGCNPLFNLDQASQITLTANNEINISGTVDHDNITVWINDQQVNVQNRIFNENRALSEGLNLFTVKARSTAGAEQTEELRIWRDTTAPEIRVFSPRQREVVSADSIMVTGAVLDLSAVTVNVNGVAASISGNIFSAAVPANIGLSAITVQATDQMGNITEEVVPVSFDNTAPEITIQQPQDGAIFADQMPVIISGRVIESNLVALLINEIACAPDSSGQFQGQLELGEGRHLIKIKAVDAAGNVIEVSRSVYIDTLPPEPFTPQIAPNGWTQADQFEVQFAAFDAASGIDHYEIKVDGGEFRQTISPVVLAGFDAGIHPIIVRAYDRTGLFTDGKAEIKIDRMVPVIGHISASPASWSQDPVTVSFEVTDELSGIDHYELEVAGGRIITTINSYAFSGLPDGTHVVKLSAYDKAGNKAERSIEVFIDNTAPQPFDILSDTTGWSANPTPALSFEAKDDQSGIAGYECRVDAGTWQGVSSPYTLSSLSEGRHVAEIRATDQAGNSTVASTEIFIDLATPEPFAILVFPDTLTSNTQPELTFVTEDSGSGVQRYLVSVNDGAFIPATSPHKLEPLKDGVYAIRVKAIDHAGNEIIAATNIEIDTTPPAVPTGLYVLIGDGEIKLSWEKAGDDVFEYCVQKQTGDKKEKWSLEVGGKPSYLDRDVINDTAYTYQIQAIDLAGNASAFSEPTRVVPGYLEVQVSEGQETRLDYVGLSVKIDELALKNTDALGMIARAPAQIEYLPTEGPILVSKVFSIGVPQDDPEFGFVLGDLVLEETAEMTFSYEDVVLPEGYTVSNLRVYYLDHLSQSWILAGEMVEEQPENAITIRTTHFSEYALGASKYQPPSLDEYQAMGASPYGSYFEDNNEQVAPESGSLSIRAVDVTLPGVNGHDLVLARNYNTSLAHMMFRTKSLSASSADDFRDRNRIQRWSCLGLGWEFDIPWVENRSDGIHVHLFGGDSYHIKKEDWINTEYEGSFFSGRYMKHGEYLNYDGTVFRLVCEQASKNASPSYRITTRDGDVYVFRGDQLRSYIDLNGNTIQYNYDGTGRLSQIIDTTGRIVSLAYNAKGRVEAVTWPGTSGTVAVSYAYDNFRDLIEVTDPLERKTHYTYYQSNETGLGVPVVDEAVEETIKETWIDEEGRTHTRRHKSEWNEVKGTCKLIKEVKYPSGGRTEYSYNVFEARISMSTPGDHRPVRPEPGEIITSYATAERKNYITVSKRNQFVKGVTDATNTTSFDFVHNIGTSDKRVCVTDATITQGLKKTEMDFELVGPPKKGDTDKRETRCKEKTTKEGEKVLEHTVFQYNEQKKVVLEIQKVNGTDVKKVEYQYDKFRNIIYRYDDASKLKEWWAWSNSSSKNNKGGSQFLYPLGSMYNENTAEFISGVYAFPLSHSVQNNLCGSEYQYLQTRYVYDEKYNLTYEYYRKENGDAITSYSRNSDGTVSSKTIDGVTTSYLYENGNLVKVITPVVNKNGATVNVATEYRYYENGLLQVAIDPRGNRTDYVYDIIGRLKTVKLPGVDIINCEDLMPDHDKYWLHRLIRPIGDEPPVGERSFIIERPKITYDYNDVEDTCIVTNEEKQKTLLRYDGLGHLVEVIKDYGGLAAKTVYGYDSLWRLNKIIEPHSSGSDEAFTTHYKYNALGDVIEVDYPDNTKIQLNYNSATNDVTVIDESGKTIVIEDYDWNDRLVKADVKNISHTGAAFNQTWTFSYDSLGRKINETNPQNETTSFDYDYLGRLVQERLPAVDVILPGGTDSTTGFIPAASYGYDDRGNKIWECGPNAHERSGITVIPIESHKTRYEYDALNRLRIITEPIMGGSEAGSRTTRIEYDLSGNRESVTDSNNLTITYEYDERNRLISETNAAGEVIKYSNNQIGNRISVTDPRGSISNDGTFTTWFVYDGLNRHIRTVMPDATVPEKPFGDPQLFDNPYAEYTYYLNGQKESEKDPNGIVTNYEYDVRNRLKKVTTDGTEMYSYFYDVTGKLTSMIDAEGLQTQYQYDYLGQVLKQTVGSGAKEQQETRYAYDKLGNKTWEWQDYGVSNHETAQRKTQYQYNALGMLTAVVDAKGNTTSYYYDAAGNIRKVTDASGNVTDYDYNNLGWLTAETYIGQTASYAYDAGGRRRAVTDRKGQTTTYQYYLNNLLEKVSYADGLTVEYLYDPAGNRKSVVQTDAQRNIDTDGDQSVTTWYNSNPSTKDYVSDPLNRVNNAIRNIRGYDYETHYGYDKTGNITSIVYPGSTQPVEYERDQFNRVKEIVGFTAPTGEHGGITYNKMGVLKRIDLPNQSTLQIASDELHRTSEINYTSTAGADINELLVMLYQYKDHENNLQTIRKTAGDDAKTQVYDYDLLDQLEKEKVTQEEEERETTAPEVRRGTVVPLIKGPTLIVTYNWYIPAVLSGCRVETLIINNNTGEVVFRDYHDSAKQPLIGELPIADWQGSISYTRSIPLMGTPSEKLGKEAYVGVVIRLLGPDGSPRLLACGAGVLIVDDRSYLIGSCLYRSQGSDDNDLHNIGDDIASGMDPLLMSSSAIDNNDNIIAGVSGQGQPDPNQERLFEYDESGNRTKVAEGFDGGTSEVAYDIGPGNRVTKAGDFSFEYDANGNMVKRVNDLTKETWTYIYDARNCMTAVQKGETTVALYAYDPEGNRFKALYPQEDGSNDGIYYHYDYTGMFTENPIVEEPESGANLPKRNFIFLNRKLFARVDGEIGSGTKYWYMTDHLGSAHGLMDQSGDMVWWADYEAFGKAKGVGGPDVGAVEEVPRYTGKAFDETVGLYYFNARWYDAGLGRFVSEDSLGSNESTAFMFCLNNPIIYFDADGHAPTISCPIPWPDGYEVPAEADGYRFDMDGEFTLVSIKEPIIPDLQFRPEENANREIEQETSNRGNVDLLNALAYQAFITPEFQPGYGGKTHCNQAAAWIAKWMGIPDNLYMGATAQEEYCLNPANGWVEITPRQAQELANQGIFVIVLGGEKDDKHAAVVVPGPGETINGNLYPSVVSMGSTAKLYGYTKLATANWAFKISALKAGLVHYFYRPGIIVPSGMASNNLTFGSGIYRGEVDYMR